MRAPAKLLSVIVALALLGAGCASHDRPDADRTPTGSASNTTPDTCSSHIDALIEARIVPRSDRDYAFQMCELNR